MSDLQLNVERVEELCHQIMTPLRDYLAEGEKDRRKVYETLNALGIAAGTIIGGTLDPLAMDFFTESLFKQMQQSAVDQSEIRRQN